MPNTHLVPDPQSPTYDRILNIQTPINPILLSNLRDLSTSINLSACCLSLSLPLLSLPILKAHFPVTYQRIVGNEGLRVEEEYEVLNEGVLEDEEGEMCWPPPGATGDGLGWVCVLGRAMIGEMGREVGYRGVEGVVVKPKIEDEGGNGGQGQGQAQSQGQAWEGQGQSSSMVRPSSVHR
jgi:hypothetical protein